MMNRRSRNSNRGSSNTPRRGGTGGGGNGVSRSHVFDSNGPEVRIRGTAFQVHEKYVALAKDAASVGDRILAENYLQHAEHYQRVINAWAEMDAPAEVSDSFPGPSEGVYASDAPQPAPSPVRRPDRQGGDAPRPTGHRPQYQPRREPDLGLPPSILGMKPSAPDRDDPVSGENAKKDEFAGA